MKVGIWLNKERQQNIGGGFSYTDKLISLIDERDFSSEIEVVFISESKQPLPLQKEVVYLTPNYFKENAPWNKVLRFLSKKSDRIKQIYKSRKKRSRVLVAEKQVQELKANKIDIVYYLAQHEIHLNNYPFIATNWDLGHLTIPNFPEFVEENQLQHRNNWYNVVIHKAESIFVESESGKEELINYLKINPDKIKVLPMFPGKVASLQVSDSIQKRILNGFDLQKETYFFYPAQFWEHKNHKNLILAFKKLSLQFPDIKLVFTGSDKGNLKTILKQIEVANLGSRIHYLGFLEQDSIFTLYKNAIALIMPTFLGPTNMPLLEARLLGCPVLCSDFKGHREQLGGGALYFNPSNVDSIYSSIQDVMNKNKRQKILQDSATDEKKSNFNELTAMDYLENNFIELAKSKYQLKL